MGCELSVKYPELCLKDVAKFENLLKKYCGRNNGNQELQLSNSNVVLLNVVTDEESLDERSTQGCSWHYTDSMECILLGMALALMIRVLYIKFKEYRARQQKKKLAGLQVIYQQALDTRSSPHSPSAPTQIQTHTTRISPYTGIQSDVNALKSAIK